MYWYCLFSCSVSYFSHSVNHWIKVLIRPNEIKDHYPKFFGQMKQALFSVRHSYFPKAGFEKNSSEHRKKCGLYNTTTTKQNKQTNQPRRLGGFQELGDFGYIGTCLDISELFGRKSYHDAFKVWIKLRRVGNMSTSRKSKVWSAWILEQTERNFFWPFC